MINASNYCFEPVIMMIQLDTFQSTLTSLREGEKDPSEILPDVVEADQSEKLESGPEKYIFCRQCHQVISSDDQRIIHDSAHEHTFANPNGLIFSIACFRLVTSCAYAGPFSQEFTWFKGYQWRIVVCTMCLTHLGWLFVSGNADSFHGLILDRIMESDLQ